MTRTHERRRRDAARFQLEPLDRRLQMDGQTGTDVPPPPTDTTPVGPVVHTGPNASDLKELGINLGGISYYSNFWPFADAMKMESRGWMVSGSYTSVPTEQLDATGNPVNAGTYHVQPFQNNTAPGNAPKGLYVVTWTGDGDVSMTNRGATLVSGSADERRKVYQLNSGHPVLTMTNRATGEGHVGNVRLWMPDPSDPYQKTLEPAAGQTRLWHPQYLDHLAELADDNGFLRFMDWQATNASPQVNWSDRRPANHQFASGEANWKRLTIPGESSTTRYGNIGVPWEYVVDLCNTLGVNAWINVPHAANDDYIRNLAKLFSGQVEGNPGLDVDLDVYIEHSNEIWSSGGSFRQGDWAQQQASKLGISKAQFNARRAVDVFRIFDQEFNAAPGGPRGNDVIRVAAAFTGQASYTAPYLAEINTYGRNFAGEPTYLADVMAVTTYFGGQSLVKQVFNETDWLSVDLNNPNDPIFDAIFDYWVDELSLNAKSTGVEGDAGAGGFGTEMAAMAKQFDLDLISYEGGPSIYTENVTVYLKDGKIVEAGTPGAVSTISLANYVSANYADDDDNKTNSDRFTKLIAALNRHPRFAEVYAAVMQQAKAQGLRSHAMFVDIGHYSKYGQWGHKEYLGQTVGNAYGNAVKWNFLKDYAAAEGKIRDVGDVLGTAPVIPVNQSLGVSFAGDAIVRSLLAAPGDGSGEQIRFDVVAGHLPPGTSLAKIDDASFEIRGTPTTAGSYRFMVRALDADNDPAYGIYGMTVLPIAGTSTAYAATADTFADQAGTGTTAFGKDGYIYAGTGERTGFLKFNIGTQAAGRVDRVVLRLYVRDYEGKTPTSGEIWIEEVGNTLRDGVTPWTEANLIGPTSPISKIAIGGRKVLGGSAAGYYEFDVTDYVRTKLAAGSDGTISFAVRGRVEGGSNKYVAVRLASRDYSGGIFGPSLVVSTSPTTAPVPPQGTILPIITNPRAGVVDSFTVTFDRPVTGVDVGDFTLVRDGTKISLANATVDTLDNVTYTIGNVAPLTRTAGNYRLTLVRDGSEIRDAAGVLLGAGDSESWLANAGVAGRYLFYNNSYFDTGTGRSDDTAVATDKLALIAGQTATFSNYSSFTKGINGVMVDISGLPSATLSALDFSFKTGNTATLANWTTPSVAPTVTVRKGAGVDGSDRVTLIWPDKTFRNTWLQVTVKANVTTGLAVADTFYFGNAVGESGNSIVNAIVNNDDIFGALNNQRSIINRAPVTFRYDYDRDALVNNNDVFAAMDNQTSILSALKLISV